MLRKGEQRVCSLPSNLLRFEIVIMNNKSDIKEFRNLLVKSNNQKDYPTYTRTLKEIIELFNGSYDSDLALYEMGIYFQTKENNYNEAIKWFVKAMKSEYEDISLLAKISLGMCYCKSNSIAEAKEIFSEIVLKYPLSNEAETAKIMLENIQNG
jgi:TolA-binding protein